MFAVFAVFVLCFPLLFGVTQDRALICPATAEPHVAPALQLNLILFSEVCPCLLAVPMQCDIWLDLFFCFCVFVFFFQGGGFLIMTAEIRLEL